MYTLAIYLYAWAVRLVSPFHKKAGRMVRGQRQTWSRLRSEIEPGGRYIWFHASSLGEFEQGRPMMEEIRRRHPQYKILLTFFSPSGYEVRKDYPGADVICYLPFDTKRNVRRFLELTRPEMAVFIKYEFWNNYLTALKRRGVPTYIISAIFRKNQLFFRWYGAGYRKVLGCFDRLFVQDAPSAELLSRYGITNVSVCGDTRFDRVTEVRSRAKAIPEIETFTAAAGEVPARTLVAGSSWPPDEALFIPYFNAHPELKLIIAPHEIHEEHLRAIEAQLQRPSVRLSRAGVQGIEGKDCVIIDCFGLLSSVYRYGQAAYIGGGFGAGIHNVLEAAVYGMPVVFGPNYRKFKEARDLIAAGGGFSVATPEAFAARMDEWLTYGEALAAAGACAAGYVEASVGATEKILRELEGGALFEKGV